MERRTLADQERVTSLQKPNGWNQRFIWKRIIKEDLYEEQQREECCILDIGVSTDAGHWSHSSWITVQPTVNRTFLTSLLVAVPMSDIDTKTTVERTILMNNRMDAASKPTVGPFLLPSSMLGREGREKRTSTSALASVSRLTAEQIQAWKHRWTDGLNIILHKCIVSQIIFLVVKRSSHQLSIDSHGTKDRCWNLGERLSFLKMISSPHAGISCILALNNVDLRSVTTRWSLSILHNIGFNRSLVTWKQTSGQPWLIL